MTDLDRAILDLESQRFRQAGKKDTAIRALGLTPTRYYQELNRIIDSPQSVAECPTLVNRLRRLRQQRSRFM